MLGQLGGLTALARLVHLWALVQLAQVPALARLLKLEQLAWLPELDQLTGAASVGSSSIAALKRGHERQASDAFQASVIAFGVLDRLSFFVRGECQGGRGPTGDPNQDRQVRDRDPSRRPPAISAKLAHITHVDIFAGRTDNRLSGSNICLICG